MANNKMREALENSNGLLEELAAMGEWGESAREQIAENNAALAEPVRNYEVGTAEEQAERYMNFCHNYPKCTGCPCVGRMQYHKCEFAWAQMPYEEGGDR